MLNIIIEFRFTQTKKIFEIDFENTIKHLFSVERERKEKKYLEIKTNRILYANKILSNFFSFLTYGAARNYLLEEK